MKILITNRVHLDLPNKLANDGYTVDYLPDLKYEELPSMLPEYHGIIINTKIKMTKEMIDIGRNLKFIGRLGSGLDIIDTKYATAKGIVVISTPEGNRNAVAEHVFSMLLALNNNIINSDKEVRAKIWNRESNRGIELENKVFGIVGLGNTGQSLAAKLSPWTQHILYYDKYLLQTPSHLSNIASVNLEELQEQSDIISFHVPLTEETTHLINKEFIEKCKTGVILINTSRGKVAKTTDLIDALESEKLGGLCLDVFENEHPDKYTNEENQLYDRLFSYPNTVFSPHVAGWTTESLQKIANVMFEKVQRSFKN